MDELLPLFLNLTGRPVLLVGGGPVAASKLQQLRGTGAAVRVVAPEVSPEIVATGVPVERRGFVETDLDGVWLVVAAATPEVNRAVSAAADARRIFVNAVDDPANATAYLSGVLRRDGVTVAISTDGHAPALTALLREALDAVLPDELAAWMDLARQARTRWKDDGVPLARRKPLLLEALTALYDRREAAGGSPAGRPVAARRGRVVPVTGCVSLVGAGPGAPDLLTRRAVARLRAADLVLFDALVDPRVLDLARRAQRFFVGKRGGRPALSQSEIHRLMIRAAARGRRVVRLKGGDPFVFGRGGEEALALLEAGVPFEIVPGVSSVLAGPAMAGMPVTHRGVSSSLFVTSGHDEAAFARAIAGLRPGDLTLVIAMGFARRAGLARALVDAGWPQSAPAAIVAGSTTDQAQVWRGTLAGLAACDDIRSGAPALIVVGEVAAMALLSTASTGREAGVEASRFEPARVRGGPVSADGSRTRGV
jgi:uroporphyrin-III C-methyltransferase/precorrin-2 dehydrogenase/sirohydrochlorin ferrochelatase